MATYYVDFVNGLDANNGLGPDASAVSNKPWKTITKLLGASGMASGDTAYLAPGVFREVVSMLMTSAVSTTSIIGDPHNLKGFKTSGGVLVAPAEVRVTGYTTNDKTAPSGSTLLTFSGRSFLSFSNITFCGGTGNPMMMAATGADCTNITFTDCAFVGGYNNVAGFTLANNTAVPLHWLFDRCRFWVGQAFNITLTRHLSADYDADVVFRNCSGVVGQQSVTTTGANTFNPGGVLWLNCTLWFTATAAITILLNASTTIPCRVENCVIYGLFNGTGLSAAVAGQLTETFNILYASSPRNANVSAGTGSISNNSYAPFQFHFGQERIYGASTRPFMEPISGASTLGFGTSATSQTVDGSNRPRPAGGLSASKAVGAFERANTWAQETGTVRTGANSLSITGPGYQDFDLAVDTTATTVAVWMRYDSTYAGTKPVISVLNGAEAGVNDATSSAVVTVNTWEQLSLSFTPTSKGVVTIRLTSTDTNGGGKAFADDLTVA